MDKLVEFCCAFSAMIRHREPEMSKMNSSFGGIGGVHLVAT
jgi:hypothetical protein